MLTDSLQDTPWEDMLKWTVKIPYEVTVGQLAQRREYMTLTRPKKRFKFIQAMTIMRDEL
ncbi:hypothetical protein N0V94_005758 [Neodidymelliopsis sp. IMI 364377]|nr:hypothetical protein N0V94_005758 [Neodidymelliopsis sp. IMI 364377]